MGKFRPVVSITKLQVESLSLEEIFGMLIGTITGSFFFIEHFKCHIQFESLKNF